jgi:hypothetical protein
MVGSAAGFLAVITSVVSVYPTAGALLLCDDIDETPPQTMSEFDYNSVWQSVPSERLLQWYFESG